MSEIAKDQKWTSEFIQGVLNRMFSNTKEAFFADYWSKMNIQLKSFDKSSQTLVLEFTVIPEILNPLQSIHGGAWASIADVMTTLPIITADPFGARGGVSVTLSCSYIRSTSQGEKVTAVLQAQKVGKNLAYATGTFTNEKGEILLTATHAKSLGPISKL